MRRKRVFILGAGFSKPAGLPDAYELTDLLIQKTLSVANITEMRDWVESLSARLSWRAETPDQRTSKPRLNVEELFFYAPFDIEVQRLKQQLVPVGRHDGETPWAYSESIEAWLSYLLEDLVELIWEKDCAADLSPITRWAEQVCGDDAVITFNYDTLADRALRQQGLKFDYGTNPHAHDGLSVMKLHGSVDWILLARDTYNPEKCELLFRKENTNADTSQRPTGAVEDDVDLCRVIKADAVNQVIENRDLSNRTFGLAGLGIYKQLHMVPGLGMVWAQAMRVLYEAEEIKVVGFSLSEFDAMAKLQFAGIMSQRRADGRPPPTVKLITPNPDDAMVDRYRRVFGHVTVEAGRHEEYDWAADP
jgi:hypothetical protein